MPLNHRRISNTGDSSGILGPDRVEARWANGRAGQTRLYQWLLTRHETWSRENPKGSGRNATASLTNEARQRGNDKQAARSARSIAAVRVLSAHTTHSLGTR